MKKVNKKNMHLLKQKVSNIICLLLCFNILMSLFVPLTLVVVSSKVRNSTYEVDLDTTDTYQDALINDINGSRYAGRIWSDKSVFRNSITLDNETDGYDGTIDNNSDFLHVFSALGSSLKITPPPQLDVMLLVDISGSMGKIGDECATEENFDQTPMYKTIEQVNKTIKTLLEKNSESRFGIVIYGATATVLVPLGHYSKANGDPFLKVEYEEGYGNGPVPLGLHFKLTATVKDKNNEIKTYYADNSGPNSNEAHSATGDGNRKLKGTGGQTSGLGTAEDPYHVGHLTNQQAGLAAAMDQFITGNKEITYSFGNKQKSLPRIPTLIHLTDGQASDLAWIQNEAEDSSSEEWKNTISNWNNVNWKYDLAYNSTNNSSSYYSYNRYNSSQLTGLGDAAPVIFQTLMTAAYYKSAVDAYYTSNGLTDLFGNLPTLNCYSIYASDSDGYNSMEDTQVKGTINATLNPSLYFTDLTNSNETDSSNLTSTDSGAKFIDTAYELYKKWSGTDKKVEQDFSTNTTSANRTGNDITISIKTLQSQLTDGSGAYADKDWANKITVDTIKKNIYYIPRGNFFYTDFENIGDVLNSITHSISDNAFTPVNGINDLGHESSVSYEDPLGKYMGIKDKGIIVGDSTYDMAMLLFGNIHFLNKAKVFDYQFIQKHSKDGSFKVGWYDKKGNYKENGDWEKGDIYYIDESMFKKLFSNINSTKNLTNNQKNTIYTFYEFTDSDKNTDKINPCYNADSTKYSLSDITVWNEDTSNLKDETGLKVDNTLYVDIPIGALPLQTVTITQTDYDEVDKYETNIEKKNESTPLRLFYGVGIQDSLLYNNGLINTKLISKEYKEKYTNKNNELSFFSNYYSATTYDGYAADTQDGARTKGDTFLTLSPSINNRYYVFQKNLKLYTKAYKVDNGELKELSENEAKNFEGHTYYGEFSSIDEAKKELFKGLKDGDIVTLKNEVVTYQNKNNYDGNGYYYIVAEYYKSTNDSKGEMVRYIVSRKGSEFGSGLLNGDLPKGDFLCWYDANNKYIETYNYDEEVPNDKRNNGANWVLATKVGGLRIGDLHQSILLKEENKTDTSKSYYLPVIAGDLSTEGSDAILDTYLGNNGVIKYQLSAKNPNTNDIIRLFMIVFVCSVFGLIVLFIRKKYFKKLKFQN